MKIIFEDGELEAFAMAGGMCVTVPFEISLGEENAVTVFSVFENVAEEYVNKYADAPLCEDALAFISDNIMPVMDKAGYEAAPVENGHLVSFTADETTRIPEEDESVRIIKIEKTSEFSSYEIPVSMVPEVDDDDPCDVYFAVVVDGRIVSFAGVNDLSDDGSLEINVETDDEFRKKGYGKAVVAALIKHLVSLGERARYCCNVSNVASVNLAKSLGLAFEKESYSFVYYSKE
ncbi:MAG: GNAT family N-acetyltransferase [Ruminococcaceae bacterium]|nr:GNAT family N-acetyltransferase [Oscillospiraceae bacterium]